MVTIAAVASCSASSPTRASTAATTTSPPTSPPCTSCLATCRTIGTTSACRPRSNLADTRIPGGGGRCPQALGVGSDSAPRPTALLSRQRSSAYFAPPRLRSWNQFFDSHLGFYARPSDEIARDLLRDGCGPLGFGCMRATGSIACEWQCCRARLPHFCTAAHGVPPAEWSGEPSHLHQPI